mmetsp:Transcript_34374/g.75205  ORF Transcript_34374/g.75205 Transcript_34374/m.75205 type:complete len:299 (-) Transcript_34374:285-1181(-)
MCGALHYGTPRGRLHSHSGRALSHPLTTQRGGEFWTGLPRSHRIATARTHTSPTRRCDRGGPLPVRICERRGDRAAVAVRDAWAPEGQVQGGELVRGAGRGLGRGLQAGAPQAHEGCAGEPRVHLANAVSVRLARGGTLRGGGDLRLRRREGRVAMGAGLGDEGHARGRAAIGGAHPPRSAGGGGAHSAASATGPRRPRGIQTQRARGGRRGAQHVPRRLVDECGLTWVVGAPHTGPLQLRGADARAGDTPAAVCGADVEPVLRAAAGEHRRARHLRALQGPPAHRVHARDAGHQGET